MSKLPVPRIATVINRTRESVVCEHTEIADNPWLRLKGLLGRKSLESGHGILLMPSPSIHSAFMRFEFDAVFLDKEFRVLRIEGHIRPWRALMAKGTKSVLELAAGEIESRGLEVGDELAVIGGEQAPADPAGTY